MRGWLDTTRLKLLLAALFAALLVPSVVLVMQAFAQLEYEGFFQHRILAEELTTRIDARVSEVIEREEARTFSDYQFLVVSGDASANFVERSELSRFPVANELPGLVGYFQVDASGELSTPLVPEDVENVEALGMSEQELAGRLALKARMQEVLSAPVGIERRQVRERLARAELDALADHRRAYTNGDGEAEEAPSDDATATGMLRELAVRESAELRADEQSPSASSDISQLYSGFSRFEAPQSASCVVLEFHFNHI